MTSERPTRIVGRVDVFVIIYNFYLQHLLLKRNVAVCNDRNLEFVTKK